MTLNSNVDYEWQGNTLVGISREGIDTINKLMEINSWPFIKELCSWTDDSDVNHPKVKFERNDEVLVFSAAEARLKRE